jgi:hypothetical protein
MVRAAQTRREPNKQILHRFQRAEVFALPARGYGSALD